VDAQHTLLAKPQLLSGLHTAVAEATGRGASSTHRLRNKVLACRDGLSGLPGSWSVSAMHPGIH